jgi:hypothetical protein
MSYLDVLGVFSDARRYRHAGVVVVDDWVNQCIQFLVNNGTASASAPAGVLYELVVRVYLEADMYTNYDEMHLLPVNLEVSWIYAEIAAARNEIFFEYCNVGAPYGETVFGPPPRPPGARLFLVFVTDSLCGGKIS